LKPVLYSAATYRDEAGAVRGVSAAARDITERKRVEGELHKLNAELDWRVQQRTAELESANRELEAFSYSVSHDLRAPLRAINGFSLILLEEHAPQLSAEAQHYLNVVKQNAERMGELVDDLLAFSRLSRKAIRSQAVDMGGLVRQAFEELRAEQEGRQLEVVMGSLPPCQGDPILLQQVFTNLLSNALKYTRLRAPARIEVGATKIAGLEQSTPGEITSPEIPDADRPVYYVKDNGVGFDMRYSDKLFGVFQRLHRADEYEGTGVGLAIVQRIVHRHGGQVWGCAKIDQGATFYFTIGNVGDRSLDRPALSASA